MKNWIKQTYTRLLVEKKKVIDLTVVKVIDLTVVGDESGFLGEVDYLVGDKSAWVPLRIEDKYRERNFLQELIDILKTGKIK